MFPIATYFTCLLITYLVYSENYHVYLLITRTNQSIEINHSRQRITVHKQPLPSGCTLGLRWFMDRKFLSTVVYITPAVDGVKCGE